MEMGMVDVGVSVDMEMSAAAWMEEEVVVIVAVALERRCVDSRRDIDARQWLRSVGDRSDWDFAGEMELGDRLVEREPRASTERDRVGADKPMVALRHKAKQRLL